MNEEEKIDPRHSTTRAVLRVAGPVLAGIGLLLIVIGMASFFSSFGTFGPPRYFWCAFVGMPLLFVGLVLSQFAFYGAFAGYLSGEGAPVVKDTFNYLAEGTRGGVKTTAEAIAEGLSAAGPRAVCPRCNQVNDADARFCKHCGAALVS
jgi:zinc-ribbon domain